MKEGRKLGEVLNEVQRFSKLKEDFVVDTSVLKFNYGVFGENGEGVYTLQMPDNNFGITHIAHGQIAGALGIPVKYYNRMKEEAPELLENNVNHWFLNNPTRRMVRTLENNARALLSDKYRRLDNEDLVEMLLPTLDQVPGIEVKSCEVTPSRLYIKAVTDSLVGDISNAKKQDIVYGGVVISNSEVGMGSLRIEPLIFRLVCHNGMIVPDHGVRKYHIGRVFEGDDLVAKLSDEAIEADDRAFWLKARDVLKSVLEEDVFEKIVQQMKSADEEKMVSEPEDAVERLAKKKGFTEDEQKSVLRNLLGHERPTKLGVSNSITRTAQEVKSYDRATELEYTGADVLLMPKKEWKEIAGVA